MAANLAAFRTLVRRDLHDEEAGNYRWTDTVLDRHIGRAVNEFSLHVPLEQKTTLSTVAGSRDLNVASLTNRIDIEAVEWPTLEFPPRRVGFSEWQNTVTMDVVGAPTSIQNAFVFWTKPYTVDAGASDLPAIYDDIICAGAAAYAALDWVSYSANRVNTGGEDVWGRYKAFGEERMRYWRQELSRVSRRNRVNVRRMYTTDAPSIFEQGRVKY